MFVSDLRTAFGLLDRDSDGHVTPAELQFMLRNLGIQVSDDLIAELIKDASKTGKNLIISITCNPRAMKLLTRKV